MFIKVYMHATMNHVCMYTYIYISMKHIYMYIDTHTDL